MLVGLQVALIAAVLASLLALAIPLAPRILFASLAVLPLVLTLPGLLRRRRSVLAWLALWLVAYAGLGSVEVIASRSVAANLTLLFALLELAFVLSLRRRHQPPATAATKAR